MGITQETKNTVAVGASLAFQVVGSFHDSVGQKLNKINKETQLNIEAQDLIKNIFIKNNLF